MAYLTGCYRVSVTTDRRRSGRDSAADARPGSLRKQAPRSQPRATPEVGIHNCIENVNEKRSVRRFDACPSLKPGFSHRERARRPGHRLDDDGVDKRSDV